MSGPSAEQAALKRYAEQLQASRDAHDQYAGKYLGDALTIGVHDRHEAELVLAAMGVSNPDAVSRILDEETEV
jgi:hypothetical protein